MALLRKTEPETMEPTGVWEDWPELFFRPWVNLFRGDRSFRFMRVEEFAEDGTLVVRADLPGIDPDKDVEITLSDHTLTIEAERHEEEKVEKRHYMCNEFRYGRFSRSVLVPGGVTEADIKASYHDGVLEVRIPYSDAKAAIKVPITKGN